MKNSYQHAGFELSDTEIHLMCMYQNEKKKVYWVVPVVSCHVLYTTHLLQIIQELLPSHVKHLHVKIGVCLSVSWERKAAVECMASCFLRGELRALILEPKGGKGLLQFVIEFFATGCSWGTSCGQAFRGTMEWLELSCFWNCYSASKESL